MTLGTGGCQVGYLLGLPITSYNVAIGRQSTEFVEAKTQKRLYGRMLEDDEVNKYSVLAMAGAASEAMKYEEVRGSLDLRSCAVLEHPLGRLRNLSMPEACQCSFAV